MRIIQFLFFTYVLTAFGLPVAAQTIESAYTKIDFEGGCQWGWDPTAQDESYSSGAICQGFEDFPIYYSGTDGRSFIAFGPINARPKFESGFSPFNNVNTVVEWRVEDGKPYAAIIRWFVEGMNLETGLFDPALRSQILVVFTVADPLLPEAERSSCPVGFVDARANSDANELARQIADTLAKDFDCVEDTPSFSGVQGEHTARPNSLNDGTY